MDTSQLLEEETKEKSMELIWKAIDGTLKSDQLISNINELKDKYGKQYESLLADVISIIDVEIGSFLNVSATVTSSSSMFITSNCNEDAGSSANPIIKKEKFYSIVNALRNFIGDDMLKERLEIETLENLKLIPKKEIFNQKYIKIKTRLFYKQQKFNLLREESEGYSKLITELGQTNLNNKILENIQSLIGCFNLDPNRVLDVILESFENNPSMYETFISLLRHYKAEDDTVCQILGFKFQSLNQSQASAPLPVDSTAHLPVFTNQSLYKITSYLLKYKIIDLDLLLAHLYPNEQQLINASKEEFELARQYAKKLTTINLSEANVNAPQGTLDSLAVGSSSLSDNDKLSLAASAVSASASQASFNALVQQYQHYVATNRLENQRAQLIKALVEIGDYKTALRLIEKLPHWYLALNCDLTMAVCKFLDVNFIDSMYKKYNLLSKYLNDKFSFSRSSSSSNSRRHQNAAHQNAGEDAEMASERDDNSMLDEFVENILPVLCALGPGLSYDTILFTKLVRICIAFLDMKKFTQSSSVVGASSCSQTGAEAAGKESTPPPGSLITNGLNGTSDAATINGNGSISGQFHTSQLVKGLNNSELAFYNCIYTILNEILLPSLSMLSMNPCLAIELWNLLKLFPYEMRYNLYQNWRLSTYKNFPTLIRAKADCQEKIKYLLKRLTKENVKIHGRQIGKLSHNNPIIVCDYILGQIQRYDNFILPVVESLKFMTPLSYDVLSYCIIVAISDADKDKMKHDSTNLSSWLQSIATFCALTFKKYPIELIAIIQYVINQLKMRKGYDLFILQEIVQKMSGIEVLSEVNDLQLEAMAGGDLLRQEAGYFNPIRNIKKCANRLKEALADYGLILPLCILLSQQRDYIVFLDQVEREKQMMQMEREKPHLKLIGCFYDQCQDSLVQFSQFLSSTLTTEEYIHIFPKIDELVNEYHVSADVAFFLSRPMYAHHIQSKYEELRRMDRNTKTAEKPSKTQRYLESIEFVMQPVIDLARSLHPAKIWEDMSPLFYTTFWTLSMSDCFVPTNAYEKQRASLKQKLNALDDNPELTSTKKKKEKEKILIMMEKLNEEEAKQRDHVQHVRARFEKEKDFWFPQKVKPKNETITVFLQLCIFSRCLFTQIDAYYCAKFIQIIHSLKTPNFSTIICYDRIFSDISYSIASLTENEARRYGRFLLGLLDTVMTWHSDPAIFEQDCAQHPGFLTVFRNALNASPSAASNKQEQLDYENFRHVCYKWHYTLTKSFIVCLESEEYLQMRNSLIILTKILPYYPKLAGLCSALEKRVEKLKQTEKDKRQDIYTLALAYLGQLKQRKQFMLEEGKFHQKQSTPAATANASQSSASSSKNQQFKQPNNPTKPSNVNGTKHSSSSSNNQQTNGLNSNQGTGASASQQTQQASNVSNDSNKDVKTSSSSSKSSQPKESAAAAASAPVINRTPSSSSSSGAAAGSVAVQSSSNSGSNVKAEPTSSPPSSKSSTQSNNRDDAKQPQSNGAVSNTNGNSKSSSSSSSLSKRAGSVNSNHSPASSQHQQQAPNKQEQLTPTRNGNVNSFNDDYSPASSVSSDDLPLTSPKGTTANGLDDKYPPLNNSSTAGQTTSANTSSSHHHHHHHQSQSQPHRSTHSRSSSPVKISSSHPSSSSLSSSNNYSKSSSDGKSKRLKSAHDDSNLNGNKNASGMESSSSQPQSQSHPSSQSSSASTSSSSSKRKSSRDRDRADKDKDRNDSRSERDRDRLERGSGGGGGGGDRNDRGADRDAKESGKKEHRKREHSSELSEIQHKRSKSDEAKKKSSSSSSSSATSSQQQQQQQQSSSSTSSSLSSKRSSKKHELNDDYQSNNVEQISVNNSGSGSTRQSSASSSSQSVNLSNSLNNGSSKHRSNDDRRVSYDKNSSSSSSYKR